MEALKKSLSGLGTRLKDGAAELAERHDQKVVKPLKKKAENFVADHEVEIGSAVAKVEELKARAGKALSRNKKEEARAAEAPTETPTATDNPATETATTTTTTNAAVPSTPEPSRSYPGDAVMEQLQKEVNDIIAKMEATGKDIKDSDEVQKATIQLMARLSAAQQKFAAFTTSTASKEEETTTDATAADNSDEEKFPSDYLSNNLKYQAEANVKRTLVEAEKIAKAMAERVCGDGKTNSDANTNGDGVDETETKKTEEK
uniref:Uncharacterized protein n=1 Tax=Pseudo-nitzschia australis TaxID=44445 RepID=A0A7S4AUI2_9STRA|mmetsp:Transcript_29139/g.60931  ORF Transcript_29139/g.60931 Transcript_29139/m.60931 type:complete len:260 (+) Transcript_29139:115-894(+)